MTKVAGHEVGTRGFGLMGFTWRENPVPHDQAFEAMRAALAHGMNFFNAGEFYGTPESNSMTLLRAYFEKYPEDADKVVISMKGAARPNLAPDGSPENVRRSIDNCLAQLGPRKPHIEVFECARRDPSVPLATTFSVIEKEYIQTGKVGAIALSEVSAATIDEAAALTNIAAVEVELSLFATDVLTNGVADACARHAIPIVAYSPLGRGLLTGQIRSKDDIPAGDFRHHMPRFQPGNFDINLELVAQVEALAARKGCTPAQLALGWVSALQRRPGMPVIIPIPGATTAARVEENARHVELTDDEMAEIDATLAKFEVAGDRYPAGSHINT